jgi:hypothetical protein
MWDDYVTERALERSLRVDRGVGLAHFIHVAHADVITSKCLKFQPGKKSAIGDKPAVRRHDRPLTWERLPFATQSILTPLDTEAQKKTVSSIRHEQTHADILGQFLEIWNEDGVAAEPEEDIEGSASP